MVALGNVLAQLCEVSGVFKGWENEERRYCVRFSEGAEFGKEPKLNQYKESTQTSNRIKKTNSL